jgi:hypothetical protein
LFVWVAEEAAVKNHRSKERRHRSPPNRKIFVRRDPFTTRIYRERRSGLIPVYYEAAAVATVLRAERFRAPQVAGDRAASNGAAS